jgi:glycosyltransferase involved in cell wall biosynthesis
VSRPQETLPSAAPSPSADPVHAPGRKPAPRPDRVWIAWERQRRSLGLARRLGARLLLCLDERRGWLRYPVSALRTVALLLRCRGKAVFVQNPSMILAALAGILRKPLGYYLVVDRHSNFSFLSGQSGGLRRLASNLLSGFTLRRADVTVVTNAELAARIASRGARPFVLPDPFPEVPEAALGAAAAAPPRPSGSPAEILFVSSWAFDEPVAEAMEACRALEGEAIIRITGRVKPAYSRLLARAPGNFKTTGFVSDEEYFDLMARCDAVMAITRRTCTLVCGAYEAIALGRPMILGDSPALREYFDEGAVYTDGTAEDLVRKIRGLLAELPRHREGVRSLLERRTPEWEARFRALEAHVDGALASAKPRERIRFALTPGRRKNCFS